MFCPLWLKTTEIFYYSTVLFWVSKTLNGNIFWLTTFQVTRLFLTLMYTHNAMLYFTSLAFRSFVLHNEQSKVLLNIWKFCFAAVYSMGCKVLFCGFTCSDSLTFLWFHLNMEAKRQRALFWFFWVFCFFCFFKCLVQTEQDIFRMLNLNLRFWIFFAAKAMIEYNFAILLIL